MGRFLEKVGWGGQLGGIQNQPGGFEEKCLVTLDNNVTYVTKHKVLVTIGNRNVKS